MTCYDLHSHSTCSDGALSPTELVERARERGVDVLALTDHDTTGGLAEAFDAAGAAGITLVPGVEISVSWSGRLIHIVGLGIDAGNDTLQGGLETLRQKRDERAVKISEKLEKAGISGSLAGARAQAGGGVLGRGHFARFLVEQGHVRDFRRAFKRYLGRGGRCHVSCEWASLEQAVAWITAAGGNAVVAHPARYGLSGTVMQRFLEAFKAAGGTGIEVLSSSHSPAQARRMAAYACEHGLYASVGSDFHQPGGWAEIGALAALPADCTPIWAAWGSSSRGPGREPGTGDVMNGVTRGRCEVVSCST